MSTATPALTSTATSVLIALEVHHARLRPSGWLAISLAWVLPDSVVAAFSTAPKAEWTLVMVPTDDDSWDITESVGATALGVAMARAAESDCDCPLFTDRYAEPFIDAAVQRGWESSVIGARLPVNKDFAPLLSKWFDESFIAAGANGIDQAVILAAGLDARAWRLPWVTGSAIYEIDQPRGLAVNADGLT